MKQHHSCQNCKQRLCASKVPIFSSLSQEELEEIVALTGHRDYAKGEMIFLEGEKSTTLYIINEGQIKLFTYTKEGKEQILHILQEGEFFGELSLFKEEEYAFNAEAIVPVKICTLTKQNLDMILQRKPEIALKLLQTVGERLAKMERLAQNLATNDMDAKIADLLLDLKEKYGKTGVKGIEIKLPLTREDMANYIGVTRETISRKLSKLQEDGIIEIVGNKKIILLQEDELREYL